jgi:hypothetical protein
VYGKHSINVWRVADPSAFPSDAPLTSWKAVSAQSALDSQTILAVMTLSSKVALVLGFLIGKMEIVILASGF